MTAPSVGPPSRPPAALSEAEVREALRAHGWAVRPAARALGISKTSLYKLVDASPTLRRASDVPEAELRAAHAAHGGDVAALRDRLCVSASGIRQRLAELGLT